MARETYISRKQLDPEIQEQLEELKKMHDYDYASKCVRDKLEKQYQDMIDTDVWYEAAKEWCNKKISTSKLDKILWDFKTKYSLWNFNDVGIIHYDINAMGGGFVTLSSQFLIDNDFIVIIGKEGTPEYKRFSLKDLHNPRPDVILDDSFKMHCIEFKRKYEEKDNSNI